ncbi:piggyBac transposable element-derived protein 3-like [Aphis gossypii]|uniref:piggyBac transposable element-derived protein 3-like n=1 Tax=Aphis gossypii TaxID=80765 RepID=UPI0021591649|nr:piggyBac transposable element-derived protein 3-like [Aphis gossypii]
MEECISLDEQICPTKARSYMKQYLPMKPHKWGYKLFVLCGSSGYAYDFEFYTGNENNSFERLFYSEPDFGATGNVVVRLTRSIPINMHHKLYFDNYYTSIPVMAFLENRKIHTVGTFRANRFFGVPIDDKSMLKKPRGTSEEFITVYENVPITAVGWRDNKVVKVASTYVGEVPTDKVKRHDRKTRTNIEVTRPQCINIYNKHMGGVDMMDSMIGRYRINIRTKKWYMKCFYHLLDMTLVNSWLIYKKLPGNRLTLAKFKEEVSVSLCQQYKKPTRGRRSSLENQLIKKKKKTNSSYTKR